MHVIYHCVGGTHSSVIAASIHLGILSVNKKPTIKDIISVPAFDTLTKSQQGKIIFRGTDNHGNKIFTISRQFTPHLVLPAIKDSWRLAGGRLDELLLVDTMPAVNLFMKIGGFSSRRLHLVKFGRPIVAKGTVQAYEHLLKIVKDTQKQIIH